METKTKHTFFAPNGYCFVKSISHRSTDKIKREKIPYISLYNLFWKSTAGTSMLLVKKSDYEKIKDIKGVGNCVEKLSHEGEWFSRREDDKIDTEFRKANPKYHYGVGGVLLLVGLGAVGYMALKGKKNDDRKFRVFYSVGKSLTERGEKFDTLEQAKEVYKKRVKTDSWVSLDKRDKDGEWETVLYNKGINKFDKGATVKSAESNAQYETRCKNASMKIATAYKKYIASSMGQDDYDEYMKVVSKTGIPNKELNKIETTISINKNYRPIDIYQFWTVKHAKGTTIERKEFEYSIGGL